MTLTTAGQAREEPIQPVPLGGVRGGFRGDRAFGVYVPTRHGGVLSIQAGAGRIESIVGPDGKPRENGQELGGPNAHGWYTFRVVGSEHDRPYSVETTFVQVGQAERMPWNYYYWPTKGDSIHEPWQGGNGRVDTPGPLGDDIMLVPYGAGIAPGQDIILPGPDGLLQTVPAPGDDNTWFPNLYDDLTAHTEHGSVLSQTPSPLLKYDQIFGLTARSWEAAYIQTQTIARWTGHCLGGAVASIVLNEPTPAPGTGLTRDELKALWAELGENHLNHRIGDNASGIPAGPPRPGYDPCDVYVPRFHAVLERNLRERRQALLSNLRAFPPRGGPEEVWNHGVGKYTARLHAVPNAGERRVRVEIELVANTGSNLSDQDPKPRLVRYQYVLVYGLDGNVDESALSEADWISTGGDAVYAPLNLMEVAESRWQGHNPLVTEANVRALDAANGSDRRFNEKKPPVFQAAAAYEGGQARYAAAPVAVPRGAAAGERGGSGSNRRSFLRIFGRE